VGQRYRNIESPQCCHAPGTSVLGSPDPQRTETFTRQTSTFRLPEPTPLTVYRAVPQVPPPFCSCRAPADLTTNDSVADVDLSPGFGGVPGVNLLCRTCVKSSVVWGPVPVVWRCSPQSLPETVSRRPPNHTSDSAPIEVHPTPTSLQFRVLYTHVCMHLYILGAWRSRVSPVLLTKNDPSIYLNTTVVP
jgi:hypothetical protein